MKGKGIIGQGKLPQVEFGTKNDLATCKDKFVIVFWFLKTVRKMKVQFLLRNGFEQATQTNKNKHFFFF